MFGPHAARRAPRPYAATTATLLFLSLALLAARPAGSALVGAWPSGRWPGQHDNSWCFRGVYDYDNCPEKETLLSCVRCCSELKTYYQKPPSKNVCLAACADQFPQLGIEWIYP